MTRVYLKIDGFNPATRTETPMSSHRWLEIAAMDWLPTEAALSSAPRTVPPLLPPVVYLFTEGQERKITST